MVGFRSYEVQLLQVRRLIEEGWTTKVVARNVWKHPTPPTSKDAVYFCLSGACTRCDVSIQIDSLLRTLVSPYESLSEWNDAEGRTKQDVLTLLDTAIKQVNEATGS